MHKRILEDALDKPPIPQFVDVKDAAKILNVSASYLNKLRMTGDGPPFAKFGFHVRYAVPAILAWAESRTRTSTSDSGEAA
jgi:Helix-turn-helix domain